MKLGLQITQTQKLSMTQEIRQSLKLLSMSSQEILEKVKQELLENPVIEELQDLKKKNNGDQYLSKFQPSPKKNEFNNNFYQISTHDQKEYIESKNEEGSSFYNFLLSQIQLLVLNENQIRVITVLISMINQRGFLPYEVNALAKDLNEKIELVVELINIIKTLEPMGVGAKDVQECLLIQSYHYYPYDFILQNLLKNHYVNLTKLEFSKISNSLDIPIDKLIEKYELIQKLNPYPIISFEKTQTKYIIPDLYLEQMEGEFLLHTIDEWIPKIKINSEYKEIIKNVRDKKEKEYIEKKITSAEWLIRAIEQRKKTVLDVASFIVEYQKEFFLKGIHFLKPMTLRDISSQLNIHESTVSRSTANKYLQTNNGIIELKWFFSNGYEQDNGDVLSSKIIFENIKNIIQSEKRSSPFSDSVIVGKLNELGFSIARRTISKYRKKLGILSASMRKKFYLIQEGKNVKTIH